jgi:hypothetical protein
MLHLPSGEAIQWSGCPELFGQDSGGGGRQDLEPGKLKKLISREQCWLQGCANLVDKALRENEMGRQEYETIRGHRFIV